ncbi:MAG: ribonuclease HII [Chloroflexi bacterium]|nr:ribonuclease HII [Chloroflexota bacterium]
MGISPPTFKEERLLARRGYQFIAGLDEVGRGSLAGPVAAAAVILPPGLKAGWLDEVRDSKVLTPAVRLRLSKQIQRSALAFGVGMAPPEVIDTFGIVPATRQAMQQALQSLSRSPQFLLIDALTLPAVRLPQKGIIHGDSLCVSIACASIVAKVARDRLMTEMDRSYPGYGLARNKGYGTKFHLCSLEQLGPCPIHRRSFAPVRGLLNHHTTLI